jgi:hypothetical protein
MKITVNQLRRIIKEEVERMMEMEGAGGMTPNVDRFIKAADDGIAARSIQHLEDAHDVLLGVEVASGDSGPDASELIDGFDPGYGVLDLIELIIAHNPEAKGTLSDLYEQLETYIQSITEKLTLNGKITRIAAIFGKIKILLEHLKNSIEKYGYTIEPDSEEEGFYGDEERFYDDEEDFYDEEEPMDEARGQKSENKREQLKKRLDKLEKEFQAEEDEDKQQGILSKIDKLIDDLSDLDFPMKESRRRTLRKR